MATASETQRIPNNVDIQGDLTVRGTLPTIQRSGLQQENFASYSVDLVNLRVWDAFQTALGTAASDDLGVATGTFGTGLPYVSTGDLKAAGATTRRARFVFQLPAEYVAGESVRITANAGMVTTVADTSCTLDFEAYKSNRDTTKTGSDLVTTSATTINSLTFAAKDFDITATSLSPGDILDVRVSIACTDAATVTAVIGALADLQMKLDIKG